jgi:hypothetical protein
METKLQSLDARLVRLEGGLLAATVVLGLLVQRDPRLKESLRAAQVHAVLPQAYADLGPEVTAAAQRWLGDLLA